MSVHKPTWSAPVCVWCGEELIYDLEKGWVHKSDGQVYRKRADGSDDHCALPKRS